LENLAKVELPTLGLCDSVTTGADGAS